MLQLPRWRVILVGVICLLGTYLALPNVLPASLRAALPSAITPRPINLGLDLQGGSQLLFEVDLPALRAAELENAGKVARGSLDRAEPRIASRRPRYDESGQVVRLQLANAEDIDRAVRVITEEKPRLADGTLRFDVTSPQPGTVEIRFTERGFETRLREAVDESREVIRRRIDPTGVNEVSIVRQGDDRINIQAPGVSDPELLKQRIGQTAALAFHMVAPDQANCQVGQHSSDTLSLATREVSEPCLIIEATPDIEGSMLTAAAAAFDQQTREPIVTFSMNAEGARILRRLSTENLDKRFAIVLDGEVISAPAFRSPIPGGSGQISGGFTATGPGSNAELALLLRSGALPAKLTVLEQRTVGAELGRDAIDRSIIAGTVAAIGILLFMVLAYGIFGIFACIALVFNLVLVLAAMSVIGATLTLPGIAGLILTLAVAVDANVLIYERMRDEEKLGRSPALSIDAGFSRAIVTILDANITTILAALILFQFGSGPVRGFAWTLSIGTVTSVFTAVFITQVLIAVWFRATRPKALPI